MERAHSLLTIKSFSQSGDVVRVEGIASTPTPDHEEDIVEPMGAMFKTPMPFMLFHDATMPVGNVVFAKPTPKGIPFVAELPIVKEPGKVQDRVNEAIHSLKYRLLGAVSIGFSGVGELLKTGGRRYKVWTWHELSLVTIGMNPEALITGVTGIKSLDTALRAASGHTQAKSITPGVSGQAAKATSPPKRKGSDQMKTLQEMRVERETKAARMNELSELRKSEDRSMSDDEGDEFDALMDEVKALDDEIRIAKFNQMNAGAARAVKGDSAASARASRSDSYVKTQDPDDKFKGQSFVRSVIARAAAFAAMKSGNFVSAAQIAEHRWGKTNPKLVSWIKAAVAGGGTGSGEWGAELAQSDARYTGDFITYLHDMTVFDKLALREVPARVHIKGQDGIATGYWVGESKAIPVSKPDFSSVELTPLKVAAMAACSKELVADSSPSAELWIRDSLGMASAERIDTTFLSTTAASAGVSPAGLLNGLSALLSAGTDGAAVRADVKTLYRPFITAKNASGLTYVMNPATAKAISLLVNSLGQTEFPGLNASGGMLLGDPVVTGDNVAVNDIILLKPSDIWKIGDTGVQIDMSDQATIEQNDAPQGAGDTPTAASATLMSLWQTDQVGFKITRRINFQKRRTSAVAYITDADYDAVES